jgi:hypothetical protein
MPNRVACIAAWVVLLWMCSFNVSLAQQSQSSGIAVRLGGSLGTLDENCTNCSGFQIASFGRLALEGQVLARLGARTSVGLEGMWWKGTYLGIYRRAVSISLIGSWRPLPSAGLYLDAGAGYLKFTERANNSNTELRSSAVGLQLGAGYVVSIAGSISVVPFVRYLRSVGVKTRIDGAPTTAEISPKMLRFGLGLQWR